MTEDEFNQLFIEVIDESLSTLGEAAKAAVYYHVEQKFGLTKEEIPRNVENFTEALEKIFGIGSKPIEVLFMQRLYLKVKSDCGPISYEEFTFPKYVDMIREKIVSKDKA